MATQTELFEIPSPCRRICVTDNRGYCRGCLRSRDERFNWLKFNDAQKQAVLRLCQQRRQRLAAAVALSQATTAVAAEAGFGTQVGLFVEDGAEGADEG
ncbi:MAG: DUF1289 domain-containing protein [Neisseriaceae bacterium]|nr:DUF1289 domain-containing protein [Neisseriaceae bacterium]MBP6861798.1 DUF1289 domain-containing protein [Neisseriaceae bacterium]